MCNSLGVSTSGYYEWGSRKTSAREQENNLLTNKIKKIFDDNKSRSGAIRIMKELQVNGETAGRHRITRLMRLNGWHAKAAKKFKATTNSNTVT